MKKTKWILSHILEILAGIACTLMITLVFLNVVDRAVFNRSMVWVEEFSAMCFTWVVFLGAACCYKKRGGLVGIDSFVKLVPGKGGELLTLLIDVVQAVFCAVFAYWGYQFTVSSTGKYSLTLRLPYSYYHVAILIAFIVMLVIAVKNCIGDIRVLRGKSAADGEPEGEGRE